jgi:hypothetical protein
MGLAQIVVHQASVSKGSAPDIPNLPIDVCSSR